MHNANLIKPHKIKTEAAITEEEINNNPLFQRQKKINQQTQVSTVEINKIPELLIKETCHAFQLERSLNNENPPLLPPKKGVIKPIILKDTEIPSFNLPDGTQNNFLIQASSAFNKATNSYPLVNQKNLLNRSLDSLLIKQEHYNA